MEVELSQEESAAIQRALESYTSDLRMEIVDTDNPGFKRELREERETLERAIAKLSRSGDPGRATAGDPASGDVWAVRLWWRSSQGS
jgi:hypothetical protein